MTSLVSTDSPAPLSSLSPDMAQVLTGVRYIMEMNITQDTKLLDIIAILGAQASQLRERDQSIMIMQSKLDSQQAIMEEIRSEQRQLTAAVACFLHRGQDVSVTLSPPASRETPEPVTPTATPETFPSAISVPELLASQPTPTDARSDIIAAADTNLRTITVDDPWRAPEHYVKTQRGGELRRQGAFYGTPDWNSMTVAAGGVPDSGMPPFSPPASPKVQEEIIPAAGNTRADVRKTREAGQETEAAVIVLKAALSDDEESASNSSLRSSCKRCRDPKEQEARRTSNPMDIYRIVHDASHGSSPSSLFSPSFPGPSPTQDDPSRGGPAKRRRLSQDIVESDAVFNTKRPTRRSPRRVTPK
ncbi:uncharacterized protein EDB91DRAFT_1248375 [Suillus paluster]|uniref:uncharacterized protein n=1 Tax=Suillus paluster TaxID=48578 RepID=UPI001B862B32|nr:uncharacterized protein EDB91DRAFT_1248375 [Suillus paluster]KAG1740491.1 hypothetical protein EDB91DRAFT_1248375 [Suillus paluster]